MAKDGAKKSNENSEASESESQGVSPNVDLTPNKPPINLAGLFGNINLKKDAPKVNDIGLEDEINKEVQKLLMEKKNLMTLRRRTRYKIYKRSKQI